MRKSNVIQQVINAAIFLILEAAALTMLYHNGIMQNIWISKGAQAVMGSVWGGTQRIKQYFSLRESNDALAIENHELRMRIAAYESILGEVSVDSAILRLSEDKRFRYIPATILKMSRNTQHNYIIVNKGSLDGVSSGDGVVTTKGAIGVIDAVSSNFSYARSFRNHDMNISARLGREGYVGPLSWDGMSSNKAILKEIPHHIEFEKGDTVFTSGYSSIFPPDIPLGTVLESKVVNGATYEIKVQLLEDFGTLRYVTVVGNSGKEEINSLEKKS